MLSPTVNLIILIIFGYLLGSIPWGYLICKAKGIDIRKVGSGNIGGTNVIRASGFKWGLLVSALDILKAIIPVYLAIRILPFDWQIASVAITPVLGHIFPVWLKFKGGKGIAPTLAILLLLLDWKILLIWFFFWILIFAVFQIMSFTNLLMISFLPLAFWFSFFSLAYLILGWVLFGLIWWAHRENLERIKKGIEPKFKFKKTL